MFSSKTLVGIAGGLALLMQAHSVPAEEGSLSTVKACSAIMPGSCATGRVRNTSTGKQVQLPNGNWIDCGSDCSRKLRKKSVDFWQEQMLQN